MTPEEKIRAHCSDIADSELLAVVLGSQRSQEIGAEILSRFGSLRRLSGATVAELTAICGVGVAKATQILAVVEIAKRFGLAENLTPGKKFRGCQEVFLYFHSLLAGKQKEHFYTVLLNVKNQVLRTDLVSIGSLSTAVVHPREVFRTAIRESASSILLVHNHPSGDPTPSVDDMQLTYRLRDTGKVVGIEVLDHIIVGDRRYTSFVDKKLL